MTPARGGGKRAEAVRFELTDSFPSLVFKTSAFNHSATLPFTGGLRRPLIGQSPMGLPLTAGRGPRVRSKSNKINQVQQITGQNSSYSPPQLRRGRGGCSGGFSRLCFTVLPGFVWVKIDASFLIVIPAKAGIQFFSRTLVCKIGPAFTCWAPASSGRMYIARASNKPRLRIRESAVIPACSSPESRSKTCEYEGLDTGLRRYDEPIPIHDP